MKPPTELNDIKLAMLRKMLEWDREYSYGYDYFDNLFDRKVLKREMRGLIAGGYVLMSRGGIDEDSGITLGGTGFSLNIERFREIHQLVD